MADAAQKAAKDVVSFGDITIDSAHSTVEGPRGKRFASPIEINLLTILANTEGGIVEKEALKMRCWGQIKVTDNAHRKLHAVRALLKDISYNVVIETKYGVGFSLPKYVQPMELASKENKLSTALKMNEGSDLLNLEKIESIRQLSEPGDPEDFFTSLAKFSFERAPVLLNKIESAIDGNEKSRP